MNRPDHDQTARTALQRLQHDRAKSQLGGPVVSSARCVHRLQYARLLGRLRQDRRARAARRHLPGGCIRRIRCLWRQCRHRSRTCGTASQRGSDAARLRHGARHQPSRLWHYLEPDLRASLSTRARTDRSRSGQREGRSSAATRAWIAAHRNRPCRAGHRPAPIAAPGQLRSARPSRPPRERRCRPHK